MTTPDSEDAELFQEEFEEILEEILHRSLDPERDLRWESLDEMDIDSEVFDDD